MSQDKVSSTDHVEAGLSTQVVAPEHPCPVCTKAMKDHSSYEDRMAERSIRICSIESCRAIADWTSGSPVLISTSGSPAN